MGTIIKSLSVRLSVEYVIEVDGVPERVGQEYRVDSGSFQQMVNQEIIEVKDGDGKVLFLYSHPERHVTLKGSYKGLGPSTVPPEIVAMIREQGLPWYD